MIEDVNNKVKERMDKSIDAYTHELRSIRTGRASVSLLDHIMIESYGQQMPINQLASLSVPEPRTIVIEPWDKSTVQDIEKSLQKSDLNLNPVNDGKVLRLNFPPLNEERRKELVKLIKTKAESAKVAIRNIRRDANDEIKGLEKDGHISKDEIKQAHDEIQKVTDNFIEKVTQLTEKKEKEIMEV